MSLLLSEFFCFPGKIIYCYDFQMNPLTRKGLYERMILSSSNVGDVVLDPFSGSGTLLRVCQQTGRCGIGIEVNPEYIKMTQERLSSPFTGFDSIDERMKRVPNDLNDAEVRMSYIENHIQWFLKNHPDATNDFIDEVIHKYYDKLIESGQFAMVEQLKL